jgi:uncharacterized phage protein gp47/JayE
MSLTSTGFVLKRQSDFIAQLQAAFRAAFTADINVDTANPDSVGGQLVGIFSERFALLYEMAQALYDSGNASNAEGVPLDNLANIIGLARKGSTSTTAVVTLTGEAGGVVPEGQEYSTPGGIVFTQDADATIGSGGSVTGVAITAVEPGAVVLSEDTITVITTLLSGLSTVTNPAAATTGTDEETDAELRLRMVSASSVTGSTTVDAIRSRLLNLDGVTNVQVIENATDATVGSQPAHTIECVVYPDQSDTDALAEAIWDNKAAGIGTYGNRPAVEVVDTQGYSHNVYFSFATAVPVQVQVTITYDSFYPETGDAQIQQLAMDYINVMTPGDDLQTFKLTCALAGLTGVVSMTVLTKLSASGSFNADNVALAPTEVARISALSDVVVNSTEA